MEDKETQHHLSLMREALAMASLALSTSETPVGCIIYHPPTSTIIGRGMNATNRSYNGTRHAEFIAVNEILTCTDTTTSDPTQGQQAGEQTEKEPETEREAQKGEKKKRKYSPSILKECILYVTVEPCIMCASFLRQIGIAKVFFGASNEKFGGTGGVLSIQSDNGKLPRDEEGNGDELDGAVDVGVDGRRSGWKEGDYEVSGGWLREEAILLLRRFYVQENERAPEPRGKVGRVLKLEVEPLAEGRGKVG